MLKQTWHRPGSSSRKRHLYVDKAGDVEPNWKALENRLGKTRCVGFMYMGRINGIHAYKHGITRTYLHLDDAGHCFVGLAP